MNHAAIAIRRASLSLLLACLALAASHAQNLTLRFKNQPLSEALAAIRDAQEAYTIHFINNDLEHLRTSASIRNESVPAAVDAVCDGLPVKVKVKGKEIFVQYKAKADRQREVKISGKVEDGFLKIPLPDAQVSICAPDSTVLVDSVTITRIVFGDEVKHAIYLARVTAESNTLLVHAQLKGYDDVWQRVSVDRKNEAEATLQMRKIWERNLDELEVQATRIKMYYRGDTIVYDATAFKLPEGSMLDDLIRQMPGVTMNEAGEIFVNGRKVEELLLGSRTFMGGNKKVLLENLPYYTVKNIKVYERQSDKSAALGYDVDPKKFVMDVNLKEEYSRGYIANAEAAAGTRERWLARGFLLGFTDRLRLTLMGNANNVNERGHMGQSGHWTPFRFYLPRAMQTTRSAAAEIDYHTKEDKLTETFRADFTSASESQSMQQRYEQFLSSGVHPTSLSASSSRSGSKRVRLHNTFDLKNPLWLHTNADFSHATRDGSSASSFDQWGDTLTASMRTAGLSEGRTWSASAEAQGALNVNKERKQHMDFHAKAQHDHDESRQARRYDTEQYATSSKEVTHNADDIENRTTWGIASFGYGWSLGKDVEMKVEERAYLIDTRAHDYLYHPDTLLLPSEVDALIATTDRRNSYDSHQRIVENAVSLSLHRTGERRPYPNMPFVLGYDRWRINLTMPARRERLDYRRGALDTLATQRTLFLNASASYRFMSKTTKHDVSIGVNHSRTGADLLNRITLRDDSQPLVVRLGNPDLQGSVTSTADANYYAKAGRRNQSLHFNAALSYHHRNTAQSVSYNPATGVYTYKPMNVSGAYTLSGAFDTEGAMDEHRHWTWQTRADAALHHSLDHAMLDGETESHVNAVNTLTLHDNAYIQYDRGALNVRATADVSWRHSEGRMRDFATLDAFDLQYGVSARYTLPRLKTTLSLDGTMYSRRGYGSATLNTDDFLLNASLTQPFLRGRLIARIEAFDLLHQLSSTQYDVNAQGRTETWYRALPHYVMAHLVWHWNKNPKKR